MLLCKILTPLGAGATALLGRRGPRLGDFTTRREEPAGVQGCPGGGDDRADLSTGPLDELVNNAAGNCDDVERQLEAADRPARQRRHDQGQAPVGRDHQRHRHQASMRQHMEDLVEAEFDSGNGRRWCGTGQDIEQKQRHKDHQPEGGKPRSQGAIPVAKGDNQCGRVGATGDGNALYQPTIPLVSTTYRLC